MNYDNEQTPLSKSLLTSVFVGICVSILCLIYNSIYREETGLTPTDIINVGSIIFGVNLLFFVIGFIHYVFTQLKTGEFLFIALFLVLTILSGWASEGVNRSADHHITLQFRGLLLGIVIISGIGASVVLPFLWHNKNFERNIL